MPYNSELVSCLQFAAYCPSKYSIYKKVFLFPTQNKREHVYPMKKIPLRSAKQLQSDQYKI